MMHSSSQDHRDSASMIESQTQEPSVFLLGENDIFRFDSGIRVAERVIRWGCYKSSTDKAGNKPSCSFKFSNDFPHCKFRFDQQRPGPRPENAYAERSDSKRVKMTISTLLGMTNNCVNPCTS